MSEPRSEGKKPMSHEEELAVSVALDQLGDKSVQWVPQGLVKAGGMLEQARSFLQRGSVPGAAKKGAAAKVATSAGVKAAGKIGNAPIQAGIELAKGGYLIGKEGAREGHAEAGRELAEEPLVYQAANLLVSPADALSKYGAAHEEKGKSAFEAEHMAPLNASIAKEQERVRGEFFAKQENERRQREIDEMKTALDPDWNLEARTMGLVQNLTRGQ
jgi:hypothetical protein